MEACGGAHDWAHRFQGPGHDIQLMPPSYVKPYVKRGKTNAADAAAIFEAVRRPSMLLAAAKSQACTSVLVLNRARDLLVRQRTQIGNAIRAHITEFGVIAAKGAQNVDRLRTQLLQLPEVALSPVSLLFEQLVNTNTWTEQLTCEIEATHAQYETCQRLATIPGVGTLDLREGLCRLARPDPQAAYNRRQTKDEADLEDGQPVYSAAALFGRHVADHSEIQVRPETQLAVRHAGPKEDESRRHRVGASHGKNDLCCPSGTDELPAASDSRLNS